MKYRCLLFVIFISNSVVAQTDGDTALQNLQKAYPDAIKAVTSHYIDWRDGTRMQIRSSFPVFNRLMGWLHHADSSVGSISRRDILDDSYEPFFRKMYGNTPSAVKRKLVTIYWMPHVFGNRYPLRVTTINGVAKKLQHISAALEKLPRSYYRYLNNPGGSFYWRKVAGQGYLSSHSFGIAVDINSQYSNYWLWDYQRYKRPVSQLPRPNHIPIEIVRIFEKEGFFWGGRWYFYDTMHFEYRPELFMMG
ncbi:MAG: hypothetical protein A3E83_00660 [Gammaproteobacteria bacterium RIFCSPHIGHO2_12_FULL_41_20]|nr:MAG: hypothetical protein A3E83_00660 [Gammaproteobacteria bacterium RIFCSPHIGHO2_12_FULL_41_20]